VDVTVGGNAETGVGGTEDMAVAKGVDSAVGAGAIVWGLDPKRLRMSSTVDFCWTGADVALVALDEPNISASRSWLD
jgi:hypothetical protein